MTAAACGSDDNSSDSSAAATNAVSTAAPTPADTTPDATTADTAADTTTGETSAPAPNEDLTVVGFFELTGAAAFVGTPQAQAWQVAIDDVNATGGLHVGDKTYTLKPEIVDITSDPTNYIPRYLEGREKDAAPIYFGPTTSGATLAISQQAGADNTQLALALGQVYATQRANDPTNPDTEWMVSMVPPIGVVAECQAKKWTEKNADMKTYVSLISDDALGTLTNTAYNDALKAAGATNLEQITYPADTVDFAPLIDRALGQNPDFLMIGPLGAQITGMLSVLKDRNYTGGIMGTSGISTKVVTDGWGGPLAGFQTALTGGVDLSTTTDPEALAVKDELEKKFTVDIDATPANYFFLPLMYDGTRWIFDSIEKAGSLDPAAVKAAFVSSSHDGLGTWSTDENGVIVKGPIAAQFMNAEGTYDTGVC
jgi:branched-chain amino acid transport system substrate-binding protein